MQIKPKTKRMLVNIAHCILFLMIVFFVLNLMDHFTNMDINIMGILWFSFGFIAVTLLILVFICEKTKAKKDYANCKYHHIRRKTKC